MLVMESVLSWGGVVDELDFAKKLLEWSKSGFPELGDSEGVVLSETVQKVGSFSNVPFSKGYPFLPT